MTKNSFFVDFEFDTKSCGISGKFKGDKLYSICYPSIQEECIEDIMKVLKTRKDCVITFECFTGLESIELLRIIKEWSGKTYTRVYWYRNEFLDVTSKDIKEHLVINTKNIKEELDHAMTAFFSHEDEKYYSAGYGSYGLGTF